MRYIYRASRQQRRKNSATRRGKCSPFRTVLVRYPGFMSRSLDVKSSVSLVALYGALAVSLLAVTNSDCKVRLCCNLWRIGNIVAKLILMVQYQHAICYLSQLYGLERPGLRFTQCCQIP